MWPYHLVKKDILERVIYKTKRVTHKCRMSDKVLTKSDKQAKNEEAIYNMRTVVLLYCKVQKAR